MTVTKIMCWVSDEHNLKKKWLILTHKTNINLKNKRSSPIIIQLAWTYLISFDERELNPSQSWVIAEELVNKEDQQIHTYNKTERKSMLSI